VESDNKYNGPLDNRLRTNVDKFQHASVGLRTGSRDSNFSGKHIENLTKKLRNREDSLTGNPDKSGAVSLDVRNQELQDRKKRVELDKMFHHKDPNTTSTKLPSTKLNTSVTKPASVRTPSVNSSLPKAQKMPSTKLSPVKLKNHIPSIKPNIRHSNKYPNHFKQSIYNIRKNITGNN